jgi:ABC-type branched-subunit amino acid transport system substrate-binding protein
MPRYALSEPEIASLVAYLKRLEFDRDPGIGADVLRIGTLLPRQGPWAELGQAVEAVLRGQLDVVNAGGGVHGRRLELVVKALPARLPEAREQVRQLMDEDLFALVSPLGPGIESELLEAAEAAGVPVVGPVALDGDEGRGGRAVFRILPGLAEQGRTLVRFAVQSLGLTDGDVAVLSADVPSMSAAAAAVQAELQRLGGPSAISLAYPPAGFSAAQALERFRQGDVGAVFFFGAEADFAAFARGAATSGWSPYLLAPAGQVVRAALQAPREFDGRVFLAYPMLPGDGSPSGHAAFAALARRWGMPAAHQPVQRAAYAAAAVLIEAVKRVGRDASRTKLIDALESLYEFDTGVTPPITFGPRRRVGALGGYVLGTDAEGHRSHPGVGYISLEPMSPP